MLKLIKLLILALLIGVACGEPQSYQTSRVVTLASEKGSDERGESSAKIIFATPHPDGQFCFYESVLASSARRDDNNTYLQDNCELLTPSSIAQGDLASAVVGNSRWANIRANFLVMPLASSVVCLTSMLLLTRLNTTHRVLLCTGYLASILGIFMAGKKLKKESRRKMRKIMSNSNHVLGEEDYHHLRKTFSVLQSSNSIPCPRKPEFAQPKAEDK